MMKREMEGEEKRKRRKGGEKEEGAHTYAIGSVYIHIPVCVLTAKSCCFAEPTGLPREVQTFLLLCRITEYQI